MKKTIFASTVLPLFLCACEIGSEPPEEPVKQTANTEYVRNLTEQEKAYLHGTLDVNKRVYKQKRDNLKAASELINDPVIKSAYKNAYICSTKYPSFEISLREQILITGKDTNRYLTDREKAALSGKFYETSCEKEFLYLSEVTGSKDTRKNVERNLKVVNDSISALLLGKIRIDEYISKTLESNAITVQRNQEQWVRDLSIQDREDLRKSIEAGKKYSKRALLDIKMMITSAPNDELKETLKNYASCVEKYPTFEIELRKQILHTGKDLDRYLTDTEVKNLGRKFNDVECSKYMGNLFRLMSQGDMIKMSQEHTDAYAALINNLLSKNIKITEYLKKSLQLRKHEYEIRESKGLLSEIERRELEKMRDMDMFHKR